MRVLLILAFLSLLLACAQHGRTPHDSRSLSATEIMQRAHAGAGGDTWVNPRSLYLDGYGIFYRDGQARRHERHTMWRVYPQSKQAAHAADGKVRIDSFSAGEVVVQIAFDGTTTYNQHGPVEDAPDSARWQSNFGFGVIRSALDDGYTLRREADDLVDGVPVYTLIVIDPKGGETLFAIAQTDYAILKVGFDTPRGWHERIYSEFFSKPGVSWQQPGRVRLFYNGIKANEIFWQDFAINQPFADSVFVLPNGSE